VNWLDVVLLLLLLGVAGLEMFRGFGRAVLDALALYGALWSADALSPSVADNLRLTAHPDVNHCVAYGLLLLALGAASLGLSRLVYNLTLMHTGMFEGLLGLGAGLAVGMILAHGLVRVMVMSDPTGRAGQTVTESFLGNEMLSFTTYHSIIDTLSSDTATQRDLPDVSH
jgi:uncharacterized membrane protein required for colicin V production